MSVRGITKRAVATAIASAVVIAALISGCTAPSSSTTFDPEITTSVPPATGQVDGIVWNNASGEPSSLDPAIAITGAESTIIPNLCEALSVLDTDYRSGPALAESIDHPDSTTWVFHLREGVTFWDGSPMTAADVVYSINRVLDPETASPWAGWAVDPSVEITGEHEVTVRVAEYNSLIPIYFATSAFAVVKQEFTEAQGDTFATPAGDLMCTGPYRLDEWVPGQSITITRNDDWWNSEHLPKVKTIEFTFVTDPAAQLASLSNGEVQGQWGIPISALAALGKTDGNLLFNESLAQEFLAVLDTEGSLADLRTRQALQASIDYEGIVSTFYRGAAEPLRAIVPPSAWGYAEPTFRSEYGKLPQPTFDLERATELAEQSGVGDEPIVLAFEATDETDTKIATSIADNAQRAGLNVELRPLDADAYDAIFYSAEAREGIDVYLVLGFLDFPDPASYYQFFTTGHYYNFAGYSNPAFDDAVARSLVTEDPVEKALLVSEAQRISMEDLYALPIFTPYLSLYYSGELAGLVPHQSFLTSPWAASLGGA